MYWSQWRWGNWGAGAPSNLGGGAELLPPPPLCTAAYVGRLYRAYAAPITQGRGSRGGARGAIAPQLLVSMGWLCLCPPKFWQSLGISTLLPPPPRKKSFPRPCHHPIAAIHETCPWHIGPRRTSFSQFWNRNLQRRRKEILPGGWNW